MRPLAVRTEETAKYDFNLIRFYNTLILTWFISLYDAQIVELGG